MIKNFLIVSALYLLAPEVSTAAFLADQDMDETVIKNWDDKRQLGSEQVSALCALTQREVNEVIAGLLSNQSLEIFQRLISQEETQSG